VLVTGLLAEWVVWRSRSCANAAIASSLHGQAFGRGLPALARAARSSTATRCRKPGKPLQKERWGGVVRFGRQPTRSPTRARRRLPKGVVAECGLAQVDGFSGDGGALHPGAELPCADNSASMPCAKSVRGRGSCCPRA